MASSPRTVSSMMSFVVVIGGWIRSSISRARSAIREPGLGMPSGEIVANSGNRKVWNALKSRLLTAFERAW
jgi:hypothetical protein